MPIDTRKFNIYPAYSKPQECRGCPLEHDGTGFAIPDGTGSLRVLILGEALGPNEAKDGLGFRPYAPAGSVLERAFRSCGFSRPQFVIFNIVNCFVSPRAGVLTPDGYKEMSKISIGDLVMTHAGRFRKVLQKISNHDRVQRYKITIQPDIYQTGMNRCSTTPIHVTVTEDHLFLNANGWKPVQNFKAGHRIRLLAEKCIECAKPFVRHFKKYGKSMAFCSVKCHNIFAARKGADKMREILLDAYRTGKRDPYAVTKAANEGMRKLLASGWRPERGANAVAKQRVAMALTREAMGHAIGKGLWVGDAERKFAAMLDGAEIDYSTQFSIGGYSFDFKIGKLLVEIDGSSHNNFETDVIDFIKQRLARLEGYSVLRVNENQLESVFALLLNDAHDYAFEDVEVIDVTRATDRAGAYTLSVEEDNSYVAQGFVNHNCLPPSMELSGTPYEIAAAQHCRVHLKKVIEQYRPKVILALGAVALRSLTGYAGKKQSIEHMRGFALYAPEFPDIPVVTSYHPSYIVRGAWNVYPVLCRDLRYAVSIARSGFNPMPVEYVEHGTVSDLKHLIQICSSNEPGVRPNVLSADWETEGNPNAYEDEQLMRSLEDLYGEAKANKKTKKARERLGTEQRVTQLNVSVKEGQSFVFQAEPELMQWAKMLLALDIPKVGHNLFGFDLEVGVYNNMPWAGVADDTMLMFHNLYPDVPGRRGKMDAEGEDGSFANLQYCASFYGFDFPWKHLVDERPEYYGCADSDASLRLYNRLIPDMQSVSHPETGITVWDSYCTLVADLWPILQGASKRGMPVNRVKILEFLNSVVNRQRALGVEIQRIIPRELLPTKQKMGLKKSPKDTTGYELREFSIGSSDERCKCFRVRKKDVEKYMALDGAEISERDGKFRAPDAECDVCGATGWVHYPDRVETRWCKLLAFNPNSPVQMKQYANFHHHKIPKNKDKKYAMDKWTLDQLVRTTRDPLYRSTIDYRQFEKMSAYAIGWMPKEDGRVHPEFSYYPATGQLSSFNPNAQNSPSLSKYGPLAQEFRNSVEAPDGYLMIEIDLRSFHAQTLGFEAKCPAYIRLAKLDVHSYVAGNMLKLPHFDYCLEWEDGELLTFLKWHRKNYTCPDGTPFQKVRDERAKVGVLAFGLGQMAGSLFTSNRDSFLPNWYLDKREKSESLYDTDHKRADKEGLKAAQLVHDALNERFPELRAYRENTPLVIKKQGGRAVSRYGCVRWFWDIQHWDGRKSEFVHGTDWEKAISFYVQNDGHGYLKYALLRAQARGYLEKYGFVNTVHDSIVFCCSAQLRDECIVNMTEELSRPSEVLTFDDGSGLSIGAEAKAGRTWGDMKEVTV